MVFTASSPSRQHRHPPQAAVTRTLLMGSGPFLLACAVTVTIMWWTRDATSLQLAPGESVATSGLLAACLLGAWFAVLHARLTAHQGLRKLGFMLIAVSSLMAVAPLSWGAMRAINGLSVGAETRTRVRLIEFRTVPQKHGRTPHRYAVVEPVSLPSTFPAGSLFITATQYEAWAGIQPDHLTVTSAKGLLGARAIVRIEAAPK
jgi:hypothetical protein